MMREETDKVFYIQNQLNNGEARDNIAQKLGYSNWRSLDMYMRRKGMKWDSRERNYYSIGDGDYAPRNGYSKISEIITMFAGKDADPKRIALQTGFSGHLEMAAYMKSNGYLWSQDINNYEKKFPDGSTADREALDSPNMPPSPNLQLSDAGLPNNGEAGGDLSRYAHLLELLLKNEDKLETLFSEVAPAIPRYTIPGAVRTKSFYMSDRVAKLIGDFCRDRNISQKEAVEAAIIEFMCKYSYKDEASKILGPNLVP